MAIYKLKCECGHGFDSPNTHYDHANDEQYDTCPKCGSENWGNNHKYLFAKDIDTIVLVLQELEGCSVLPDYERGIVNKLLNSLAIKEYLKTTNPQ